MTDNITLTARLGHDSEPPSWTLDTAEQVPLARWGKDHWSTFAYVETRWVDHHGMLDHDRMRCDSDLHPFFAAARPRSTLLGTRCRKYPTRLKSAQPDDEGRWDVVELADHDDYNCLDDAIHAGLIEVHLPTADIEGGASHGITHHETEDRQRGFL